MAYCTNLTSKTQWMLASSAVVRPLKTMESFTNLHVIFAPGPCSSCPHGSSFSVCDSQARILEPAHTLTWRPWRIVWVDHREKKIKPMIMTSYSTAINNCNDNQAILLAVATRTNSPWLLFRFILDLNTSTVDSFLKPSGSAGRKKK